MGLEESLLLLESKIFLWCKKLPLNIIFLKVFHFFKITPKRKVPNFLLPFFFNLLPFMACLKGILVFPGDMSFPETASPVTFLCSRSGEASWFPTTWLALLQFFLLTLVQSVLIPLIHFPSVPTIYLSAIIPDISDPPHQNRFSHCAAPIQNTSARVVLHSASAKGIAHFCRLAT